MNVSKTKRSRGRPPKTESDGSSVSLRFGASELEALDALASQLVPGVKLSRHEAIRAAVSRGVEVIQAELAQKTKV